MKIWLACAIAAASIVAPNANAAVFMQNATVSGDEPDYTHAYLDFAGFDASLGTLNGVTIYGTISVQERIGYAFASSTSSTVPVTLRFDLNIVNTPYVYIFQNTSGSATYTPGGGEVVSISAYSTLTDVLPEEFVRATDLSHGFAGQIGTIVSSPAYPTSVSGTVTAQATAVYDYTPVAVPEPSSLALLGILGLVPVVRRRTQS